MKNLLPLGANSSFLEKIRFLKKPSLDSVKGNTLSVKLVHLYGSCIKNPVTKRNSVLERLSLGFFVTCSIVVLADDMFGYHCRGFYDLFCF